MENMKKTIELLILLGCMMLPIEYAQASSPLFFGSNGESASPTSVATINSNQKLSQDEIIQFLEYKLLMMDVADDMNIHLLARAMRGYSYADIQATLDEVQRLALQNHNKITMQYFDDAYLNIRRGLEDVWLDEEYNTDTAIHEAGHVVASLYKLKNDQILHDITIKPRGESLGETISYSLFESVPASLKIDNDVLQNLIIFCLSGGVANQLLSILGNLNYKNFQNFLTVFEKSNDVAQARKYARAIVMKSLHGLHEFSFVTIDTLDHDELKIQKAIDRIIEDCYELTWSFINYHQDEIITIADLLVIKGRVSGDEIYNLIGIHKPLYDFQQGPLPKSLVGIYQLRGHAPELKDEQEIEDLY